MSEHIHGVRTKGCYPIDELLVAERQLAEAEGILERQRERLEDIRKRSGVLAAAATGGFGFKARVIHEIALEGVAEADAYLKARAERQETE